MNHAQPKEMTDDGGAERGKVYLTIKLINFFESCIMLRPRKIIVSEREG